MHVCMYVCMYVCTLKVMVMQNVCENCIRILEDVRYLKKEVKEVGILIDKSKRVKPKAVPTLKNIAAVAEINHRRP